MRIDALGAEAAIDGNAENILGCSGNISVFPENMSVRVENIHCRCAHSTWTVQAQRGWAPMLPLKA